MKGAKSGFFNCMAGVRQGENLSPLLFAMYLSDLSKRYSGLVYFKEQCESLLQDDELYTFFSLLVLIYADDTIILAESENELQKAIDCMYDNCKT